MKARQIQVIAGVFILFFLSAAWMNRKDPFAGKWKITAQPETAGKQWSDVLTFKGGKMTIAELGQKGWGPAEFEEDVRQGGIAQFKSTVTHATQGTMKWTGNISATEIRGTIIWTKTGKDEERYNYTGTKHE